MTSAQTTRGQVDPSAREAERRRMVETRIAARGVRDEAVLRGMREVPREAFLPEAVTPLDTVELVGVPGTYPFGP